MRGYHIEVNSYSKSSIEPVAMCVSVICVCACICLSMPSNNQSFYMQITSYGMSVDVDRVA